MDALALLCTIHADGPATLARLRSAGIATLAEVVAHDTAALGQLLRSGNAQARRFQREAGSLCARLESETQPATLAARKPARRVLSSKPDKPDAGAPRPREVPAPSAEAMPRTLEDVLARWRSLDEQAPDATPAAVREQGTPSAAAGAGEPAVLAAGSVDGLDAGACALLAASGISTLEALASCDPVAVGAASGLGYTRVYRWRGLAARALRSAPRLSPAEPRAEERGPAAQVVAPPVADYVLQPAPRVAPPRPEAPSRESAAGPFA